MIDRVTFHRDGAVRVNGMPVGTYRSPDPSGAPWARTPVWVFTSYDGRANVHRRRGGLARYAVSARYRQLKEQP
jgi:hypothetical protein